MYRFSFLIIFILNNYQSFSQNKNSNWFVGFAPAVNFLFDNLNKVSIDTFLNNKFSPLPATAYGSSNISDSNGKQLLLCNGYLLYNSKGLGIKNWENVNSALGKNFVNMEHNISYYTQMSTILPKSNNQYYVFTTGMSDNAYNDWKKTGATFDDFRFDVLMYHIVDMNANNGAGEVISKNNIMLQDARLSHNRMAAVQHGNGRDWWLVKPHKQKHKFYNFLVTDNSISLYDSTDYGDTIEHRLKNGQSVFSEDGRQYAFCAESYFLQDNFVYYYKFDRCTSKMSGYRKFTLPLEKDSASDFQNGVAFSPNGRFLYVSSRNNIWQIDLQDTSNSKAIKVAGPDSDSLLGNDYLNLKLAPNGKIYVGNGNGNNYRTMCAIDNPDEYGSACNFVFRELKQDLTFLMIPPNNPKYDMGALKGCACDTIRPMQKEWLLYPNPSNEIVNLKVPNSVNGEEVKIEIVDMLGNIVLQNNYGINYEHEAKINITRMAKGIYILKAKHSGEEFISKFVKE
jgi:hypothetical protein